MASRRGQGSGTLLISVLFTLVGARNVNAQALDFTLDNETGVDIGSVRLRPSHTHAGVQHEWSNDILGVDILGNGQQARVSFPALAEYSEGRRWDLVVYDRVGNVHVWKNIELSATNRVTLFYDRATGRTWASTR